jgi:hypothetical protein
LPKTAGLFIIDDAHPERSVDGSSEITIEYGTKKAKDWETSRNLGFFHATKQWKEGTSDDVVPPSFRRIFA